MINKTTVSDITYFHSIVVLEKLLSESTHNDPEMRPSIEQFKLRFDFWLNSNEDYFLRNGIEWRDAIDKIFPISIPMSCTWQSIIEIKHVLNIIFTKYDNLNHSFFPRSGGMDFVEISIVELKELEYLLINDYYLMTPESLCFEFMNDINWSYFRLNVKAISPIFGFDVHNNEETIYIDGKGNVFREDYKSLKEVRLYLNGSFLIVQKTAHINGLEGSLNHYRGIHNQMTNEEYKKCLKK